MRVLALLYRIYSRFVDPGVFFRLRLKNGQRDSELWRVPKVVGGVKPLGGDEKLVVVGGGVAALAFLEEAKRLGARNVTWIYKDREFGGTCVNFGCMPSEFYFARKDKTGLSDFLNTLRTYTETRFTALDVKKIEAEVTEIKNREVVLKDGLKIAFDRLILATGAKFSGEPGDLSLATAWSLIGKPKTSILIETDHDIALCSLAEILKDAGHDVTVLFHEKPALQHLPAVQAYLKELTKRGVRLEFEGTRYLSSEKVPGTLRLMGRMPNWPAIDDEIAQDFARVDFVTGAVAGRTDIHAIGDAGGFVTAGEAERQGADVARLICGASAAPDLQHYPLNPIRLHGAKSLALCGTPVSYLQTKWRKLDFKALGWSFANNLDGELWYHFDRVRECVDAVHVLHRDAGEIIALARFFIDLPLTDPRWHSFAVHPSAAEIFALMHRDIEDVYKPISLAPAGQSIAPHIQTAAKLPTIRDGLTQAFFKQNFSNQEIRKGLLDSDPQLYFCLLWGLRKLGEEKANLVKGEDGRYKLASGETLNYVWNRDVAGLYLKVNDRSAQIFLDDSLQS